MPVHYDEVAGEFDGRYRHQPCLEIQRSLRRLARLPGAVVLEVGCGTGHWLGILDDLPIQLLGIDASRAMLEKAQTRATRAALICASAENIPLQANSLDLIFCVNALHQFSVPERFLRNSRLHLKNGGRLAIFGLDPHAPNTDWYLYDYFPGVRETDLARYLPTKEIRHIN
jgi:ubiquinone/menaquinone biosynthesis C-methylase UbiE